MLDLDHFKGINDTFGHPFGDRCSRGSATSCTRRLRTTDAPCRYGGEEFALILTETDPRGRRRHRRAHPAADRECPFRPDERHVQVTASFGVACSTLFTRKALTLSRMVTAADDALYRAKHEGRNRVCSAEVPATT